MSILSLLSKLKPFSATKESAEVAKSFPLIQKIPETTHAKVIDLLIGRPYDTIRGWLKNKLDKSLPGLIDTLLPTRQAAAPESSLPKPLEASDQKPSEEALSGVEKAFADAEKAEQDHMRVLGKDFEIVSNQYRKNAGLQMIRSDDTLMKAAQEISDIQVAQGALNHEASAEVRKKYGIEGEILSSGFSSPEEALKKFVESKEVPPHYNFLMGSYSRMGYSIRRGIEEKTGEPMYFLTVVYKGGKALGNENDIPKKEVPKKTPPPALSSLPEYFQKTPTLKKYFDALDLQIKEEKSSVNYALDVEKTKREPFPQGDFWITFSKDGKKSSFLVSTCPILFYRLGDDLKLRGLAFSEILKELDSPEVSLKKEEPEKKLDTAPLESTTPQKPSTPSIEELKKTVEKAAEAARTPEVQQEKEPEVLGLS